MVINEIAFVNALSNSGPLIRRVESCGVLVHSLKGFNWPPLHCLWFSYEKVVSVRIWNLLQSILLSHKFLVQGYGNVLFVLIGISEGIDPFFYSQP